MSKVFLWSYLCSVFQIEFEVFFSNLDPMPALKMKVKSSTSVKEVSCLYVAQKSSKISKTSGSLVRLLHETAELDTSIQNCENGSSKVEFSVMEDGSNKVIPKMYHDEEYPCQKRFSCAEDPISLKRMDFPLFTCSINSEAMFSPLINGSGIHLKSSAQDNEGCEDGTTVPEMTAGDYDSWSSLSSSCQTSNASDSHISDMSVPVSIEGIGEFDDILTDYLLTEPDYAGQNLMLDMTEECMNLPALEEEPVEKKNIHFHGSCEELSEPSEYSWFHPVSQQIRPNDHELDVNSNSVDLNEADFDPQLFIRNFLDFSDMEADLLPVLVPKETSKRKHVTLVLDLDETLVHSTMEPCDSADFTFQISFDMKDHTVYVRQRPFLRTFLERVAEMFEVVIFTASQSIYAEQLLDLLDPDKKYIARRLFRESCIFSDGSYTKDLTVVGVDLSKIAIIDNSPQVFRLQVNNGIPIESWFDDPSDTALVSLIPFLETLANVDDVRPIIAKKIGMKE
ncbi:probable phosphatase PSR2 isoform X1 [Pistacia vera]|uniref:probable phosphatase PSR2 isoform X1 n=2 Tax=Pistacia vera TaxID=55513 RepID=UPI001262FE77|nr:probable phosphatase PSR2 isoform X1 [Pistacia vera]